MAPMVFTTTLTNRPLGSVVWPTSIRWPSGSRMSQRILTPTVQHRTDHAGLSGRSEGSPVTWDGATEPGTGFFAG